MSEPAPGRTVPWMTSRDRTILAIAAAVVFVAGGVVGFAIGRTGVGEVAASPTRVAPSDASSPPLLVTSPPPVVTPTAGLPPAIGPDGQILREGSRPVVKQPVGASCHALVSAGFLGECGEVAVAGNRVIWVVQTQPGTLGTTSFTARIFTWVAASAGWVEWLQASDGGGGKWADVNVVAADLTGDGVPELLVGFRSSDEKKTLDLDVVSYTENGLPQVVAHPDPAALGSVVVSGGNLDEYAAQYPNDEAACCPPSYLRQTIAFEQGYFRVVASVGVPPNQVPPSQI